MIVAGLGLPARRDGAGDRRPRRAAPSRRPAWRRRTCARSRPLAARAGEPGFRDAARTPRPARPRGGAGQASRRRRRGARPARPGSSRSTGSARWRKRRRWRCGRHRARLVLPRIASARVTCALARGRQRHDGSLHRRRTGRAGPHHGARTRPHRALPGLPLCGLAHSAGDPGLVPAGARIVDTAPLDLDAIIAECARAHADGQDVARLQSGDLSIWSAVGEQIRRLDALGIPYTVTPGVPAFAAAAAALARELTVPGVAQSVVLTRTSGRASAMPATRDPRGLRGDPRDAGDPPLDPRRRAGRRGADRPPTGRTARSPWSCARPGPTSASCDRPSPASPTRCGGRGSSARR